MKLKIKIIRFLSFFLFTQLFISCNSGYESIDGKWVYVSYDEGAGKRIRSINVNNKSFKIINKYYAKDNFFVFYKGRMIKNANSKTFEVIKDGYSKDKYNVYLYRYPLFEANPNNFQILGGLFSRDDNNIYCGTIPLNIKDISSFKVIEKKKKIITIFTKELIKKHPEYSFINTNKYKVVVYGKSIGESNNDTFEGITKIH